MEGHVEAALPSKFKGLFEPYRNKAGYGGRGSAKSHSYASALVIMASQRTLRVLCCREIQKSIQTSVKQLLDDKIAENGLNDHYNSTQYEINGRGGSKFIFAGLRTNPDSVKSTEGIDIAWVEEANTVSQRSIDLLTPTVRRPNSELWWSWNRRHESDPVDKMFLGGEPPPRSLIIHANWRDNPWFPDVLREEMEWDKSRDHDKYLHVWEGHPIVHSEARVFRNWRTDDIDDKVPGDAVPLLGADWGFSIDPTVLIEAYVWDRTLYIRREAYKVRCEIDETPALFYGSDNHEPPRWSNVFAHEGLESVRHGGRIVADSARPETISYMKKRGFNIVRAVKGANSVEEGVEFMKSYDIVVHPDCKHVETELTLYSYKTDPLTEEVLAILKDRHNHTIDACRYAVEMIRRWRRSRVGIIAPEAIPLD